jgi:hypothetical protein
MVTPSPEWRRAVVMSTATTPATTSGVRMGVMTTRGKERMILKASHELLPRIRWVIEVVYGSHIVVNEVWR